MKERYIPSAPAERGVPLSKLLPNGPCNLTGNRLKWTWKHRCGRPRSAANTPRPCTSEASTQHSERYRTTGALYPFWPVNARPVVILPCVHGKRCWVQSSAPLYVSNRPPRAEGPLRPPPGVRWKSNNRKRGTRLKHRNLSSISQKGAQNQAPKSGQKRKYV